MSSKYVREGLQLLSLGRPREAYAAFWKALKDDAGGIEAALGCARASTLLGRGDVARTCLKRVLELVPNHVEAAAELAALDARQGQAAALEKLAQLASSGGARVHLLYGEVLRGLGRGAEAAKQFERAGRIEARNPELQVELGRLALARADWSAAIAHFHDAGELLPDDGFPKLLEARALAAAGHVQAAVLVMTRAHQLAPREPVVYRELFQLCLVDENHPGALRAARELAALEPASAEPLYLEGLALLLSSDATGAEQKFQGALGRDPKFWQAKQALAKVEVMRGKQDVAQALLEAIMADEPTEPGPANDLAALYLGGPDGGPRVERLLRPVLAEHPADPTTAYNLALALQGRAPPEAKRLAQLAAQSTAPCAEAAKRLLASFSG